MTKRDALSAVLAAILVVPAAAGLADTPCDLLPTTNKQVTSPARTEDVLCNVCGSGVPLHGARDPFGNGLDYNDGKRWECEIMKGNRGTGGCKSQTTCLPGGERFFDNGVYRCRYPAVVVTLPGPSNPRDACERGLRVSISRVKNIDGLPLTANVVRKPGPVGLLIEGDGAANGVFATIGGGISVSVGAMASRIGSTPRSYCLPPNCQVVDLANLGNAPTGNQTLTLYTPHHYASASVDLFIAAPTPTPSYSVVQQNRIGPGVIAGSGPLPVRDQNYTATLTCPGGQTSSTNVPQINNPTPVFEIRSARVQATVIVHWLNSRTNDVPICSWTEPTYAFTIKAHSGQADVTVSWLPNPNIPNMDTTQTISLTQGRWQIFPDANFPPDFTYTVMFHD
jgi:hypothetical protein